VGNRLLLLAIQAVGDDGWFRECVGHLS
jgi:hypothetical protein